MLKLHGFKTSNYYSAVKLVLLEKGIAFDECPMTIDDGGKLVYENKYLEMSPIAKVPSLETQHGFLSETSVIIDFLDTFPGPSFYPPGPYERAKVKELIKYVELYLELPARRLYGEFFGKPVPDDEKETIRSLLQSGFAALDRLAVMNPYLAGTNVTYADFFARYTLASVTRTTKAIYNWDTYRSTNGLIKMFDLIDGRDAAIRLELEKRN